MCPEKADLVHQKILDPHPKNNQHTGIKLFFDSGMFFSLYLSNHMYISNMPCGTKKAMKFSTSSDQR